jgi:predicted XRE-type DNA-binding protein
MLPDEVTVQSLRCDVALQLARFVQRLGYSQTTAAKHLAIPQPTLSKIVNGRVSDLSIELLIRIAVRAGLSITLQTGRSPEEAGAFVAVPASGAAPATHSRLAVLARESVRRAESQLTASQRLEAFLEHSQLMASLPKAGQAPKRRRTGGNRRNS